MRHIHQGTDDHGLDWGFIHSHTEEEWVCWPWGDGRPERRRYYRKLRSPR